MHTVKFLAVAAATIGLGVVMAPKASACASCLTQPAVIDNSAVLTQPAIIDNALTAPVMMTQPAVIDNSLVAPVAPVYNDVVNPHLLNLDTPFFGIHLF